MRESQRRGRRTFTWAAITAALIGLLGSLVVVSPASAEVNAVFSITKSVTDNDVAPGDSFTYQITVNCSPYDCENATLVDVIPAQFDALTLNSTVAVTGGPSSYSWGGTNDRTLTVNFLTDLDGPDGSLVGLAAGSGYQINISMSVPGGLSPDWPSNNVTVTNTAEAASPNAPNAQASTDVTVRIPYVIDTTVGATWAPSSEQFSIGKQSILTLTSRNTSNALATSLTILAPTDPTLAGNFFEGVNFAGFGTMTLPAGADQVQVDAWVAGAWVLGAPGATPALDPLVVNDTVTGLRVIFSSTTGASLTANGAAGSIQVLLQQRSALRSPPNTSLVSGANLTAAVRGTVVAHATTVSKSTTATYAIGALTSIVDGSTSFTPGRIPAGTGTLVSMTGQNASNGILQTLTITEVADAFLNANVAFDGFRSSSWPTGATSASIEWFVNMGTAPTSPSFTSADALPAIPTLSSGQRITGFAITYSGAIAVGSTASAVFRALVDAAVLGVSPDPVVSSVILTNTIRIDGQNDAGDAIPVTRTANLEVIAPTVNVTLNKTVTPAAAIPAGGRSIVRLLASTSTDTGYVSPTKITVEDLMTADPADYWRAFNATAISSTQVPFGSKLTISYTTDGTTWQEHAVVDATLAAQNYQGALPTPTAIVGLRFVFENSAGFAQGTSVRPAISFQARDTLRDSSPAEPTAVDGTSPAYTNWSTAVAEGTVTLGGDPLVVTANSGSASAVGIVKVVGAGSGGVMFDKTWVGSAIGVGGTIASQSGATVDARLRWGVEVSGYSSATVSDPANVTLPVAQTVFQAFDLIRINPITVANDPLIAYDKVTLVELYNGTSWVAVNACSPASACTGGFDGYTLTGPEVISTKGVRITFAEDTAARSGDPLAPPIGSGIASGPDLRPISLTFQLRNQVRDATGLSSPWITETTLLNSGAGVLQNTALLEATGTPGSFSHTDDDSLIVDDSLPNLGFTKITGTGSTPTIAIPNPADVLTSSYPNTSFTVTGTNTSLARAWYLRVTDVMPCTTGTLASCVHNTVGVDGGYDVAPYATAVYDPATNPFEQFDIRSVSFTLSSNSGIDLSKSVVTRWIYTPGVPAGSPGTLTTDSTLFANSSAMSNSSTWTNVVGVSVLYTGTSTADGGTIASGASAAMKIDVRLRQKVRSDSTVFVSAPRTVTNESFAQIWDNVLEDDNRYDSKSSYVTLVEGTLNVSAGKSLRTAATGGSVVSSLLEKDRATDIVAQLTAGSNGSTVSSKEVVVEDTGVAFWDNFALRSLGTVATIPSGSNRLRVEVQLDGGSTWIGSCVPITDCAQTASNGMTPTLPALGAGKTVANITGIRYIFYKADGSVFSASAPAASWSTTINFTVRLRDALRLSGAAIAFPVGGNLINTVVSATSTNAPFPQAQASANTNITLNPGTFTVDVAKTPAIASTPAGETVNWSLKVTNTGTGYLTNPVVVDTLPVNAGLRYGGPLLFDPTSEVTYSTSTTGAAATLPTTGMVVAYDNTIRKITFTWPSGARLAPGETLTLVVPLQVAPGLTSGYGAVLNTMSVTSDRTLSACTNTTNARSRVFTTPFTTCATDNVISVVSASAISTFKGVKGNVDGSGVSTSGATNINNAATACVADAGGFYRNPCAANSVIGGTDLWKVQFTNGGNIASDSAVLVDVLPKTGDTYLTTGTSRGSTFAPVFDGGITLITDDLSAGTKYTWQVSTVANPCPAFSSGGTPDPDCSDTASWQDGATYSGANSAINAIRVIFDFSDLADDVLPPAATLAVTYKTINTPSTSGSDGRAPVSVPVTNARAWNSFGVYATFGDGNAARSVEPIRAGVQLATGPLQVTKSVIGTAAAYAPVSYQVHVACTVSGATVTLPSSGNLTLAASNAVPYSARIDGIPVGASCTVNETTTGASGVTYTTSAGTGTSPAAITIAQAASSSAPVPADQQATVTNTYGTTNLLVSKAVTTTTTLGTFGPYNFTLVCTVNNGVSTLSVPLAAGDAAFTLAPDDPGTLADESQHLVEGLPVTAACSLRETNSDSASTINVLVNGGSTTTVAQNGPVSIALGTDSQYTAAVTNHFAGGKLSITKTVTGAGGASYGSGPFEISIQCTYEGDILFTDTISIVATETRLLAPVFPVGTSCDISETVTGGATTAATDQSVTIVAPSGSDAYGLTAVGLTNAFAVGTLKVDKTVTLTGPSRTGYGTGPFTAQVVCTWVKRVGTTPLVIPLPNSGVVTLSPPTYSATVTGLIAGASCTVTELGTAGATTSTVGAISPATVPASGQSAVTITNDFASGTLTIIKDWAGTDDSQTRFGAGPFEVEVACEYYSTDHWVDLDLGSDSIQSLEAPDYRVTVDGILAGAECTVVETDAGLATSSALSPNGGVVTIVASGSASPQAEVTVTNTFETGKVEIVKLASESLVQGSQEYDYTFDVTNVGTVAAAGVTIVDAIPATLEVLSTTAAHWACDVAGKTVDGYGGTLTCLYDYVLAPAEQAELLTVTVGVLPEIAQDTIDNEVEVTSTTRIVDGDTDDESVDVKWLDVAAVAECVKDAQWLDYTVDAHNLDVGGRTMTVTWADSSGNVIHTDSVPITSDGVITGRLLWPGAEINADEVGIGWPGWRLALPGETPDWGNLVLDTTLPEYALRADAQVTLSIIPEATVTLQYPPATADCAETPDGRESGMWFTKTASVANIAPGDSFDYVMTVGNAGLGAVGEVILVDDIPTSLKITKVTPLDADPGQPEWVGCLITDRLPNGYGGVITCELDRSLGYQQTAPGVVLTVTVDPSIPAGMIVNTAKVTANDRNLGDLTTLALQDSAMVMTAGLAATGLSVLTAIEIALLILVLGLALLLAARIRARRRA